MVSDKSLQVQLSRSKQVDIGEILDNGSFTPLQIFIVVIIALAIILDGFDSQLLAYAIPTMMKDWGYSERSVFTFAVVASSVGMVIGSLVAGYLADKIGRRRLILITLTLCGLSTMLIGLAGNVHHVMIFRFFAGIGIGGALPVCTTLSAEFSPLRYRTMIITASIVCVPLGGMLAGFYSKLVLVELGWQKTFFIGGFLPLVLLILLWFTLPESPKYMARHKVRWQELQKLLLRLKRPTVYDVEFVEKNDAGSPLAKTSFGALLSHGFARNTVAIWFAFFFCMSAVYSVFGWLPAILASHNIDASIAGDGLTAYNIGGIIGSLLCAFAISRFGSFKALGTCAIGGALSILALLLFNVSEHISLLLILLTVHGFFVNAVQSPLYALAAFLYPTQMRATGTATAAAFGRCGAILAGICGGFIAGLTSYIWLLGFAMFGVFIALISLKNHIPAVRGTKSKLTTIV
ncbi:MFS transporter [Bartonella sp. HY038]|uniref:MFS transporter n=1 Tax=Bartonella sp. HY038 TaxID=2759660 RepID=UPI0015F94AA5|nr:MFS transporter [Bartonella sp. HY038]